MPAASSTRIGLIQEPQGSKVKKLDSSVNTPAQAPFAPKTTYKNLGTDSSFDFKAARLPALPINSTKTKIRTIINHEINYALDLGISVCNRVLYGFNRAIRALKNEKPDIYSATYAGLGYSSVFAMILAPNILIGELMNDPKFTYDSFRHFMVALSLKASVCFAIPFCLNLSGNLKFLDSEKLGFRIKGFKITPTTFTIVVSNIGVLLSSLTPITCHLIKKVYKTAKNKNPVIREVPTTDSSEKAYSINWSIPNLKLEDSNYYGNGTILNQPMHPFGIASPAPVSIKDDD